MARPKNAKRYFSPALRSPSHRATAGIGESPARFCTRETFGFVYIQFGPLRRKYRVQAGLGFSLMLSGMGWDDLRNVEEYRNSKDFAIHVRDIEIDHIRLGYMK
jgi:hypothetical protein